MATPQNDPPRGIMAFNASRVGMLQSLMSSLEMNLGTLPSLLRTIIEGDCWRVFKFPDREAMRWNAADFRRFIESRRPEGCETPIHILERGLRGTDTWELYLELIGGQAVSLREPETTIPLDPEAAASLLVQHFRGEALTALIRSLSEKAIDPGLERTRSG